MVNRIEALYLLIIVATLAYCTRQVVMGRELTEHHTIKVAVIDTGFDFDNPREVKVCTDGHKDFSSFSKSPMDINGNVILPEGKPYDTHGHGTHVAGLIAKYAGDADYCLVFLKYFKTDNTGQDNLANSIRALKEAQTLQVDVVNYSGGGPESNESEKKVIQALLDAQVKLVMAAGNENENIEFPSCKYYPASYDPRIIVVGALKADGNRLESSNYGAPVDVTELGEEVESIYLNGKKVKMSGTSQATAIHTGKVIKELCNNRSK